MLIHKRLLMLGFMLSAMPLAATAKSAPQPFAVDGFRSAHFGMSEADTLNAIKTDFNIVGSAVVHQTNPILNTQSLRVIPQALLTNSGQAVVTYVFGYKSKSLVEIDITWAASAPGNSPMGLFQTGATLQNYFVSEAFSPHSVSGNSLLNNGDLLLFRGSDAAGHAVALVISGSATHDNKDNKTNITPALLTLAYVEDPAHPDTFKIKPGTF
ncbi:hypothetical protein [Acidocella sp.]|jgi:hypothetical protein|uniref:hypothetical protein n=1 Tax=Acidocella sp. TaxID=50710 RepID=UPI002F41AE2D